MTNIAIVGSGPSGCYLADMLAKKLKDARIDVYDRLPTPFGLARAGVAPDHQGTKNIIKQLERTFARGNVTFVGNVTVGKDVTYSELKEHYDAVALTVGAMQDRSLNIPGDELNGVYGSGAFVGWYNGHPDYSAQVAELNSKAIAIVGNGNVSLDIARVLAKTESELASSDISKAAASIISATPLQDIYLIGRRSPADASFTNMELNEFAELERCVTLVNADDLPANMPESTDPMRAREVENNLATLRGFSENNANDKPIRLHLLFNSAPVEVLGDDSVQGLRLAKTKIVEGKTALTDETFDLDVQTVISAIGYRSQAVTDAPFDDARGIIPNEDGIVEPGVYTAGWCKRGPQGVIPANRMDAMGVGKRIIADLEQNPSQAPTSGFDAICPLLDERQVRTVSYTDWEKINAEEVARATGDKPREKLTSIAEMLALLD